MRQRIREKIEETFKLCYVHRDSLEKDVEALLDEAAEKLDRYRKCASQDSFMIHRVEADTFAGRVLKIETVLRMIDSIEKEVFGGRGP